MIAAQTARSQAYLQALVANDLIPGRLIFLGGEGAQGAASTAPTSPRTWMGLSFPDLGEPLSVTCRKAGIPVTICHAADVNSGEATRALEESRPDLVIYSGVGGQIVRDHVLALGAPFLHLHSGWLPDYRGSTTIYYALLNEEDPAVTALILDRSIDTGPILARRHYPKPPAGMDIDRIYDASIRADLLVRVIQGYVDKGKLSEEARQDSAKGNTYYVIHPVLKHLAMLSLGAGDGASIDSSADPSGRRQGSASR